MICPSSYYFKDNLLGCVQAIYEQEIELIMNFIYNICKQVAVKATITNHINSKWRIYHGY